MKMGDMISMHPEDETIIKEALKLSIKSRDSARNLALKKAKQAASWKKKADAAEAERDEAWKLAEKCKEAAQDSDKRCGELVELLDEARKLAEGWRACCKKGSYTGGGVVWPCEPLPWEEK